jgi:hypothetical protein
MATGTKMIMVIRHAEKPDTYNGQAYDGVDALGDTCGKDGAESLVTICWQHEDILSIGQSILKQTNTTGITLPPGWPSGANGARYDLVWVFSGPTGAGVITSFTQVAQMLLAGDAAAPT